MQKFNPNWVLLLDWETTYSEFYRAIAQYGSVKPKTYVHVGWGASAALLVSLCRRLAFEERNPTFIGICWVEAMRYPTYNYR